MPKLYHAYLVDLFDNSVIIGENLWVAETVEEVETYAKEEWDYEFNYQQVELEIYEVTQVDGYKIQLVKQENPTTEHQERYLEKVLEMYGLKVGQEFLVNKYGFSHTLYCINNRGDLLYYNYADNEFQLSGHTLGSILACATPADIKIRSFACTAS